MSHHTPSRLTNLCVLARRSEQFSVWPVSRPKTLRLGCVGVPGDIARVVLFAASDVAAFMTGSALLANADEVA